MTPAEFRSFREYLGLSTQWIAVQLHVNPRAVLRWESPGSGDVPPRAVELLLDMRRRANEYVDTAQPNELGTHLTVPPGFSWEERQYPPAWYRHLAVRVAEKLGHNVLAIEYIEEAK